MNNLFLLKNQRVGTKADLEQNNRYICEIGVKLGKPVVATGDVHFLNPYEEIYRRVLLMGQGFEERALKSVLFSDYHGDAGGICLSGS